MFWSNQKLTVIEKDVDWGKLRYVQLGEYGRGRKPVNITVPESIAGEIHARDLIPYEVGLSKTMKPKLVDSNKPDVYLAIDTLGAYIRGAEGKIEFLKRQSNLIHPIAFGWGAFGDAGRIGYAPACLIKALPGAIIRYKLTRSTWEVVQYSDNSIRYFNTQEIEPAIDADVLKLSGDWMTEEWISVRSLFGENK